MSSQVRVVKKDQNRKPAITSETNSERQRNREMVAVIKGWIAELQLRQRSIAVPAAGSSR